MQGHDTLLYITTFIPGRGEAKIMYMQKYDELNNKDCTGLPVVLVVATLPEPKHE